jgi:hypothetical protein
MQHAPDDNIVLVGTALCIVLCRDCVLLHLQVSSGVHTLNPVFADNLMRFQHVGMRSMLRVLVYDRRSALDSRLLGVASLPAAAVPASGSAPVYMWVPLSPPASRGKGRLGKLQVRLSKRWINELRVVCSNSTRASYRRGRV